MMNRSDGRRANDALPLRLLLPAMALLAATMSELFQMDPRRGSFYQWLKGRRGPGDLPYVGYAEDDLTLPPTQPAAAP